MKIITIYTLYGRRAGAELCFEKTVESVYEQDNSVEWIILCNQSAKDVIEKKMPFTKAIYIKWLDNQYKKAFWLAFFSNRLINQLEGDVFWIPSGCNHFPGKWNIPVVSTFHDLGEYHVSNKYSRARMFFRKRICIPLNLKRAKRFTTVSEYTKQDMIKFLRLDENRINVVYNGASPHALAKPANASDIVSSLGLKKGGYFFTPGRTDYIGKGLDILLCAFRSFSERHKGVSLVLVGPEGEGHQTFIKDVEEGAYKEQIHYLGRVDDEMLVSLYTQSLATVISSRFEGFGFPVLEAMRYNTPIICSDAGSLEEVAGDAALIFHSEDSDMLVQMMARVYNAEDDVIDRLRKKGEERLKQFSWKDCAEQMLVEFKAASNEIE